MAKLQKQLIDFHEKIRLRGYEENKDLLEKRDLLLNALQAMCVHRQCLLAPDSDFLALCVAACATMNDHVSQGFRLLPV